VGAGGGASRGGGGGTGSGGGALRAVFTAQHMPLPVDVVGGRATELCVRCLGARVVTEGRLWLGLVLASY
jgi:hypothetical protein